jgi:hypothetical protein
MTQGRMQVKVQSSCELCQGSKRGVGHRKRPPHFPGAKLTRPHSDPDEAVNENGGRWLKHHLSP